MAYPMPQRVPEPGFYYHYKHDSDGPINKYAYEVLGVGFHTEEARPGEEHFVIYRPLYEEAPVYRASKELGVPCFDSRPLEMWMGEVMKDDTTFPGYQKIIDPSVIAVLERIRAEMY
jgi:hypothetical protein